MHRLVAWFNTKRYKVIYSNVANINQEDDPSYPYLLEVCLDAPEFSVMAWTLNFKTTEEIVLRARRLGYLRRYMRRNNVRHHPRLISYTLSGPKGTIEHAARFQRS